MLPKVAIVLHCSQAGSGTRPSTVACSAMNSAQASPKVVVDGTP
jgi:hypothetical protein